MVHPTATVLSPSTRDDAALEILAADDWFAVRESERAELEAEAEYLAWCDSREVVNADDLDALHAEYVSWWMIRVNGLLAALPLATVESLEWEASAPAETLIEYGVPGDVLAEYVNAVKAELARRRESMAA